MPDKDHPFFSTASSSKARSIYEGIEVPSYNAPFTLGPFNTHHLLSDPKRVGFMFARYKFVARMLLGHRKVLEIGCQEGLGSMVVAKEVKQLIAVDFYRPHIESCLERMAGLVTNIEFRGHDIIEGPVDEGFSGAFSLDVLEHIDSSQEDRFMTHVCAGLESHGVLIVGMPSLESQVYASPESRAGHINCKSGEELRRFCASYFHNVFMFSMNDEMIHTGFLPMSHYLFALCAAPKR